MIIGQNYLKHPSIAYYVLNGEIQFAYAESFAKMLGRTEPMQIASLPVIQSDEEMKHESVGFVNTLVSGAEVTLPVMNLGPDLQLRAGQQVRERILQISSPPVLTPRRQPVTAEELNVGEMVGEEQKQQLTQLLNENRAAIVKNMYELGKTNAIEMDIKVSKDEPIYCKPYKATQNERETMREIVRDWKDAGIVREINSPYASPVLLVKKKNGKSRLVGDYRKLNALTQRMPFPLPDIDECTEALYGSNLYATLDLYNGYLQVPLSEEAAEKTAFITPDETGEFTRCIFGLMNAPFYFSKLMEKVLGKYRNTLVIFFLDDILIFAKNWEELMSKLKIIIETLKEAGLTLNLEKCVFGVEKVEYLGFILTSAGIKPGEQKVNAIHRHGEFL